MNYLSRQKGFTLVEMIVSLAIFAVVSVVALGALLRITDANKKSQSLKTGINNLNFALESMSREMRVGANYYCDHAVPNFSTPSALSSGRSCNIVSIQDSTQDWYIAFTSSKQNVAKTCNLIFAYYYNSDKLSLQKGEQNSNGNCTDSIPSANFADLISPDVKITDVIIHVNAGSGAQPKAFFWLKGHVGDRAREKTEFELQTTVSQRVGGN